MAYYFSDSPHKPFLMLEYIRIRLTVSRHPDGDMKLYRNAWDNCRQQKFARIKNAFYYRHPNLVV